MGSPHLPLIVLEDGLASNAPHIRKLREYGMRFILGVKPGDHKALFDELESNARVQHWESTDGDGTHRRFRVLEQVALNKTNKDVEVNVLEYWETKPNGKRQHFSWVTDLPVNRDTAMKIMRAGRARWRIENETFNTLKNAGYNLEQKTDSQYHILVCLCHCAISTLLTGRSGLLPSSKPSSTAQPGRWGCSRAFSNAARSLPEMTQGAPLHSCFAGIVPL